MQTYHALQETGTIAILRGWSCIQAMPLVQALYAGGIRMAEVAVDNLDAFETVAKLRKNLGRKDVHWCGNDHR